MELTRSVRPRRIGLRLWITVLTVGLAGGVGCEALEGGGDAVAGAEASATSAPAGALETDDQKSLYAIGLGVSQGLLSLNLSEEELGYVMRGLTDGVLQREPQVDMAAQQAKVREFAATRTAAAAETEKRESQAFVDEAAGAEGAVKTDSGLVYLETQAGDGDVPSASDTVKVHYHGTLRDGTVFDSSVERNTPATFPLTRIIPCWSEALQRMKPGTKATIVCPSELAYGERGAPPRIPGGAALKFEVELIEVVKPAASPADGAP